MLCPLRLNTCLRQYDFFSVTKELKLLLTSAGLTFLMCQETTYRISGQYNAQDQRRAAWPILQATLATVRWILMLGRTLSFRTWRQSSGDDAVVASINWLDRLEVLKVHIAVVSGGRHKMAVLGNYRSDGLGN
jgi:hypothetical protein